jgi:hypothetical protein
LPQLRTSAQFGQLIASRRRRLPNTHTHLGVAHVSLTVDAGQQVCRRQQRLAAESGISSLCQHWLPNTNVYPDVADVRLSVDASQRVYRQQRGPPSRFTRRVRGRRAHRTYDRASTDRLPWTRGALRSVQVVSRVPKELLRAVSSLILTLIQTWPTPRWVWTLVQRRVNPSGVRPSR